MTDNDYIAEYVKEKHPHILGVDFFMWKVVRFARYVGMNITSFFSGAEVEEGDNAEEPEEEA